MIVWGLDLSTKRIGIADGSGQCVSVRAHAGADDPYRRLHELTRELSAVFRRRPPRPDLVVLEDYSLNSPGRIALVRLGEIGGIVRTWLWENDVAFRLVPPTSIKKFATGNGNADKPLMISCAVQMGARASVNEDEADAWHARRMGRAAHQLEGNLATHELAALDGCGVAW
jgi:crossover junction endodeoxyribonuclease RuvC